MVVVRNCVLTVLVLVVAVRTAKMIACAELGVILGCKPAEGAPEKAAAE